MVLRAIVAAIGILVMLVGLTELIFPDRLIEATDALMRPTALRILGIVELVLGLILIAAALNRAIGLTTFALILGTYVILIGIALIVAPGRLIGLSNALLLDASPATQSAVLGLSGVVRILIGAALFWSTMRPLRPVERGLPEHR